MNQFFNFFLVSRKNVDAIKIKNEIERNKLYKVEFTESSQTCINKMRSGGIHCLVFNFDTFNTEKIPLVANVREAGFFYPIIIFASIIDHNALDTVQKLHRVIAIEKPFESKDVWGICQKFLQGQKVNQRIFRRYYTDQTAALEKTSTGESLNGRIYNLSRGGAYLELGKGRVSPGETVRVTISLDKISRQYNVNAEVVWSHIRQNGIGQRTVGLRFIKPGDVYRNLLHKL